MSERKLSERLAERIAAALREYEIASSGPYKSVAELAEAELTPLDAVVEAAQKVQDCEHGEYLVCAECMSSLSAALQHLSAHLESSRGS